MKRFSTLFLKTVIVLMGIGVLVLMLWEPHLEGRNANATLSEIYFNDPFLACAYVVSIAFFIGLYQAFRLAGYAGRNELFSQASVNALRIIRRCGMFLAACIGAAVAYLFIVRPGDDIAGGVAIGLFLMLLSFITARVATVFGRNVQKGIKK